MANPAEEFFTSIDTIGAVEELIYSGEAEAQYLECKSPHSPHLTKDLRAMLSQAASGFANSGGGIILWGVSTEKHQGDLDILSQIEPIGQVKRLQLQVDKLLPRLVNPSLPFPSSRLIRQSSGDSKGLMVTYIPPSEADPIQSEDGKFYIRTGDEFREMPYSVLQRMFTGASAPDLQVVVYETLAKIDENGVWDIPIGVDNVSTTAAKGFRVVLEIVNPDVCESLEAISLFQDRAAINPGKRIWIANVDDWAFRGMPSVVGRVKIKMKKQGRPLRILNLQLRIFTDRMRARQRTLKLELTKTTLRIKDERDDLLF